MSEPITHGGPPRGYKRCVCARCGVVATCTPAFDFYTRPSEPTGPLYCERCIWSPAIRALQAVTTP